MTGVRKDRPLEWFLAGFSLLWSVTTHLSVNWPSRIAFEHPTMPFEAHAWANVAGLLGLMHMVGLLINGTMAWTPLLRLLVTAANAGFFAWVAALLASSEDAGSSILYGYVTIGFLWCAYVAGQDTARMRLGTYGL